MSPWEYFINKAESLDEILKPFEEFLSSKDYIIEENGKKLLVEARGLVDRIHGYKIVIYPNEHYPPHFHIIKDNQKLAAYTIDNCKKINGNLPRNIEAKIVFYHELAKDKLIKFWKNTRPG